MRRCGIQLEPPSPTPGSRRIPWLPLFTALGVLWYASALPRFLTPDTVDMLQYAACLDGALRGAGAGPCPGADYWSPGLPLLVVLLERFGLSPMAAVRLLSLLAAAAMPVPVYGLGRLIGGRRAGLWAAALTVPCVALRVYALLPDARLPALLLIFATYAAVARWLVEGKLRHLALAGAAGGGVVLLRPEGKLTVALALVAIAGAAWVRGRSRGRAAWSDALRGLVWAESVLMAGAAVVVGPVMGLLYRLNGRIALEPRSWELPLVGWMPYIPLKIFHPLFDIGAQPTPLREAFRRGLEQGRISVSLADRVQILGHQLAGQGGAVLEALAHAVPLEQALLAVAGLWALWRRPGGRWAVALWVLVLSPLLPLAALPQTFNPQLPEGNLLFVPVAVAIAAGVALAAMQEAVSRRRPRLAVVVAVALASIFAVRGALGYSSLLQARGGTLFESSVAVRRAARWLEVHSAPSTVVRSSYAGAAVPMLAGRTRQPWPSAWEIPAWRAGAGRAGSGAREVVVITSIDLTDDPLAVREWLEATPRLELLHHEDGPGVWVAILAPPEGG
jgi:hypothetical protein